jgi:hypothetical protein
MLEAHDSLALRHLDQIPISGEGAFGPYPDNFCIGNIFCDRTLIEIVDPCFNPFEL